MGRNLLTGVFADNMNRLSGQWIRKMITTVQKRLSDENLFHLQLKSHQNYDLVISIVSLETKVHDIKEKNHRCQGEKKRYDPEKFSKIKTEPTHDTSKKKACKIEQNSML